ncbi:MAG TPA: hypothetical protein DCG69_00770 [Bacteroidales bacterium]|nr:hypothetical protein [Bacteroidales bacterium]
MRGSILFIVFLLSIQSAFNIQKLPVSEYGQHFLYASNRERLAEFQNAKLNSDLLNEPTKPLIIPDKQKITLLLKSEDKEFLINIVVVLLFLTSGLLIFLFVHYRNRQKIKRINSELKARLEEKDILNHELQHRVKNNLTMLLSLLEMQSHELRSKDGKKSYADAMRRIRSMALIHESSYSQAQQNVIDLELLAQKLFQNFSVDFVRDFKYEVRCQGISLIPEEGIKIGMMLSELISNALQHAIVEKNTPLKIEFVCVDLGNTHSLLFRDNGSGIENYELKKTQEKIGMFIINSMVRQLRASIEYKTDQGSLFKIQIPNKALK